MKKIVFFLFIGISINSFSQNDVTPTIVSGNIQTIGQYYQEDTLINAAFLINYSVLMVLLMSMFSVVTLELE